MNILTHIRDCGVCLAICVMTFAMSFTSQASRQSIVHTENFDIGDFSIDNFVSPSGDTYTKLSWANTLSTGEVGQPELLVRYIRFLVPDSASDFSVEISNSIIARNVRLDYPVYPVQEPESINEYNPDVFTAPDVDAYLSSEFMKSAEIMEDSWLEGRYHVVTVALYPVKYNASTNELGICGSIDVSLSYTDNMEIVSEAKSGMNEGMIDIADFVVNPGFADINMSKSINPNPNGESIPSYYYIISERKLLSALKDLEDWKRQKGYNVVVTAIEDIFNNSEYKVNSTDIVDEAASLRSYLSHEFDKNGSFFCLLVGDHKTKMPIRKLRKTNSSSAHEILPNGNNYIPTDNYFSDLSKNGWNVFRDASGQYVGDLNNTQYTPSIYVGRLLCHTSEQIDNYISKLILYESNPGRGNTSYLDETCLYVQYDGKDDYSETLKLMQSTFENVDCKLDVIMSDSKKRGYPTGKMMLESINKSGYSSLMGHSEPSTIACSGIEKESNKWEFIRALESYRNISDTEGDTGLKNNNCNNNGIDLMTNFDSPSVIYSIGCTTCPFDIYENMNSDGWHFKYDIPHTVPSSYTVGGRYGGVAFLGNTRVGYWATSPLLEHEFLEAIKSYPKIGIAEAISKYSFLRSKHVRHTHNLIGDPEFELWRRSPQILNVNLTWQNSGIKISGSDVQGCTITLNDGQGNIKVLKNLLVSRILPYCSPENRMEAVSVFKTGFLPIVSLKCQNQSLANVRKSFVVRTAEIGSNIDANMTSGNVRIGSNSDIEIYAVDEIQCGSGVNIDSGGNLTLRCDDQVKVEGCKVESGGKMNIRGEIVIISNGFSVAKGGVFKAGRIK